MNKHILSLILVLLVSLSVCAEKIEVTDVKFNKYFPNISDRFVDVNNTVTLKNNTSKRITGMIRIYFLDENENMIDNGHAEFSIAGGSTGKAMSQNYLYSHIFPEIKLVGIVIYDNEYNQIGRHLTKF